MIFACQQEPHKLNLMLKSTVLLFTVLIATIGYSQPPEPHTDLFAAVKSNNLKLVKQLITDGSEINERDLHDHSYPIEEAIQQNNLDIVKYLIEHGANKQGGIHRPVAKNNIEMVKYLLSHGYTPGKTTVDAAENNNFEMLKALVEAGAPVDYSEKRRRRLFQKYYVTPVGFAVEHKNEAMILYFIEHGISVNKVIDECFSHGNTSLVKKFSKDVADKGPLLLRAFNIGSNDLVAFLIKEGANVNSENQDGNTMLLIGAKNGDLAQVVDCLEKYKLYIHKKNNNGETALMLAAKIGNTPICEYLIKSGIKVDAQSILGRTALFYALEMQDRSTFDFLVQSGANIKHVDLDGDNLLIAATKKRKLLTVKMLFSGGMDLNHKNKEGHTAYYYTIPASSNGDDNALMQDFFIREGAEINTQGISGKTALFVAVERENMERILALIEKGANVDVKNYKDQRPECHEKAIVMFLIKKGADINAVDAHNNTYLCDAVDDDDLELAHFVINHGADPNIKCYFKEQPIIKAVEENNLTLVKFLVENGADVNAVGYFNKNVMEYAVDQKVTEIISYLKSKGAMTKSEKNEQYRIAMELEAKIKSALIAEDLTTVNRILSQNDIIILQRRLVENLAFVSAKQGNTQLVNKLLSEDVAFNLEDHVNEIGQTMLFIATMYDQDILVKDLLARGADFDYLDSRGKSAVDYVQKKSIKKIYKNWAKSD